MNNIILTTSSELETLIQNSIRKVIKEGREDNRESSQEIFTLAEACKFLNLAKQTIYGFTSKNKIPFVKRGKKLYFKKVDLVNWLMEGKQLTKKEIEGNDF